MNSSCIRGIWFSHFPCLIEFSWAVKIHVVVVSLHFKFYPCVYILWLNTKTSSQMTILYLYTLFCQSMSHSDVWLFASASAYKTYVLKVYVCEHSNGTVSGRVWTMKEWHYCPMVKPKNQPLQFIKSPFKVSKLYWVVWNEVWNWNSVNLLLDSSFWTPHSLLTMYVTMLWIKENLFIWIVSCCLHK